MTLHSVRDGSPGPNLLTVIGEARLRALKWLSDSVGLLDDGVDGASRAFVIPLELSVGRSPHRDLLRPYGLIRLEQLAMDLVVTISQSRFEYDRGRGLDLALAVENYVTRQRSVVTRRADSTTVASFELKEPRTPDESDQDVLQNGVLLGIFTEPWVALDAIPEAPQRTAAIGFTFPNLEAI
jgi:hypothetical protein